MLFDENKQHLLRCSWWLGVCLFLLMNLQHATLAVSSHVQAAYSVFSDAWHTLWKTQQSHWSCECIVKRWAKQIIREMDWNVQRIKSQTSNYSLLAWQHFTTDLSGPVNINWHAFAILFVNWGVAICTVCAMTFPLANNSLYLLVCGFCSVQCGWSRVYSIVREWRH